MKSSQSTVYTFPFFGAGFAYYYEWAEIMVLFEHVPTVEQINQIIETAPKPIKPGKNNFAGHILSVSSARFVNMVIEEFYGGGKDIEGLIEVDDFDPAFYVSERAADAFENDIERWLNEIQRFCSIEVALRAEDTKAGGTELSEWHYYSISKLSVLLTKWKAGSYLYKLQDREQVLFRQLLEGIFYYGELKDRALLRNWLQFVFQKIHEPGNYLISKKQP